MIYQLAWNRPPGDRVSITINPRPQLVFQLFKKVAVVFRYRLNWSTSLRILLLTNLNFAIHPLRTIS